MMAFSTMSRFWRVVLFASLALNLIVAGLVIGAAMDRRGPGPGEMRAAGPIASLVRALPAEDRRAVIGALRREGRPDDGGRREDVERHEDNGRREDAGEALLTAIRAEPFDPDAVTRALSDQRMRGEERFAAAEAALAARLAAMDAAARAGYADALETALRRHR